MYYRFTDIFRNKIQKHNKFIGSWSIFLVHNNEVIPFSDFGLDKIYFIDPKQLNLKI